MTDSVNDIKLDIRKIKRDFGDLTVLDGIDFQVRKGEVVSIIGRSGSGKTTLLNILAGIDKPDTGDVLLDGRSVIGETGNFGYMFQKDLLMPWRTSLDNATLPLILHGIKKKEARRRAEEFFPLFGIEGSENKYPFLLSGGMQKRVALLRTHLCGKEVLLLDEPFAGLDAITKKQIHRWLLDIISNLDMTLVLVTHDIEEAVYLSDTIYVISEMPAKIRATFSVPRSQSNGSETIFTEETLNLRKEIENVLGL